MNTQNTRVLVVDDDPGMRDTLEAVLKAEGDGYDVQTAWNCVGAMTAVTQGKFDIMLLDQQLPDGQGIDLLHRIKAADPELPVIMMTAYGSIKTAVEAVRRGVYDFIPKPFELEDMQRAIRSALEMQKMSRENPELRGTPGGAIVMKGVIGANPRMLQVMEVIKRVINYDVTILITGESGTGKEVVTRAIHDNSARRDKPFIKLNCATVPESLLESELFGHEKGAFTGATGLKPGRFELAEKGTLFLDEICDTSPAMQSKLLRVLQDKEYERVGGTQTLKADVRIVCATNKDIKAEVDAGRFRTDLYFRLNVIHLQLPPLRERLEDVPELVRFLLAELNQLFTKDYASVSPEVMALFMKHRWPGNIRELRNVLEKAMLLGEGKIITLRHLPEDMSGQKVGLRKSTAQAKTLEELETERILEVLGQNNWNQSRAADLLGIHRNTLREKIRKLNIKLPDTAGGNQLP